MFDRERIPCGRDLDKDKTELDMKVEAYLEDDVVKYRLEAENENAGRYLRDKEIKLPKDSGAFEIRFKLKDDTKRGLRFREDCPISASEQEKCPSYEGIDTRQISVVDRDDSKLSIRDENWGAARTIGYALHFIDDQGRKETYDPIIENGGGTKTFR